MGKKVIILGGGVAGMSAAHELVERGFAVEVYERKSIAGGKARSIGVPGSGMDGRKGLPAEHGFRFFPRFYKHLPDTMRRIPFPGNRHGVYDNLVQTTRIEIARYGLPAVLMDARFPRSRDDVKLMFSDTFHLDVGVSTDDKEFFGYKVWQLMTTCEQRRLDELEKIGWWDFIDAGERSAAYQEYFGFGLTRSLVAAKANLASTKTVGDIFLQLMFDELEPGMSSDRVLNGPTNDVWIDPWLAYLTQQGVGYHREAEVTSINCVNGVIESATVSENGQTKEVKGDYYIAALPVEVMAKLITPEMLATDPTLGNIQTLAGNVSWMNGIQFYLKQDVPITSGHSLYVNSEWALTSISQRQFWRSIDLSKYGDGTVKGIISVDISEWTKPGLNGKAAMECALEEIKDEVWAELKKSLNVGGSDVLKDEDLHSWFLDPDIVFFEDPLDPNPQKKTNREPLLVNLANTWALRPDAFTRIPNFFVASDYVQTNTDLATMEGANEAARRAANCIIDIADPKRNFCPIWKLYEPVFLVPWREHDLSRWAKGLPWDGRIVH